MKNINRGFIALIASVLISTVLLGLSSTIGVVSWYARLGVAEAEDYQLAKIVAQSCVEVVELRKAENPNYLQVVGEVVAVGDKTCKILSANPTITTQARIGHSIYTLENGGEN